MHWVPVKACERDQPCGYGGDRLQESFVQIAEEVLPAQKKQACVWGIFVRNCIDNNTKVQLDAGGRHSGRKRDFVLYCAHTCPM